MMIRALFILGLSIVFQQKPFVEMSTQEFFDGNFAEDTLTLKNTRYDLLDAAVFHTINQNRIAKQLPPFQHNGSLYQVARQFQDELEFRPFTDGAKISSKLNNQLTEKTSSAGYLGKLTKILAAQNDGIHYDGTSVYFYDAQQKSEYGFQLYYGKKSAKNPTEISAFTYQELAKQIVASLSKEDQKIIYSNVYQDCGVHLLWYYKTLNRRKIPQIKTLIVLGGFATKNLK